MPFYLVCCGFRKIYISCGCLGTDSCGNINEVSSGGVSPARTGIGLNSASSPFRLFPWQSQNKSFCRLWSLGSSVRTWLISFTTVHSLPVFRFRYEAISSFCSLMGPTMTYDAFLFDDRRFFGFSHISKLMNQKKAFKVTTYRINMFESVIKPPLNMPLS